MLRCWYMKKWVVRNKNIGQTPLEVAELYRTEAHLGGGVSLAYAGRLDPMAHGKVLILIGDECKRQEHYHGLDKAYRFEVLFGFKSDTGDVLGVAEKDVHRDSQKITETATSSVLKTLIGKNEFPYPLFSSKTVKGKPLHMWTLENRLDEIEIPTRASTVYTLSLTDIKKVSGRDVLSSIFNKINSIPKITDPRKALGNDFRRDVIRKKWHALFEGEEDTQFFVASVYAEASSGTYMRTLAEEIGRRLGVYSLAFSIERVKIGKTLWSPFGRWWYTTF